MMVLATALLAGSLLATGAQAHGGAEAAEAEAEDTGAVAAFSAGSMGGFGGGHVGGFGGGHMAGFDGSRTEGMAEITMAMEDVVSAAIPTTGSCPYYPYDTSYDYNLHLLSGDPIGSCRRAAFES